MSEGCCGGIDGSGCGCQSTTYYTASICPKCGSKLRLSGNPRTIKYHLDCNTCDYQSQELTMEEFRDLMD